jgi:regulation of enolase protein 1 (concanavalin A-like superfamily)
VFGNLVYDIAPPGTRQSLIHGIYQIASGTVANNIVHHTSGIGITLWHDAHDIVIANNTVFATKNAAILVGAGDKGIRGGALSARAGDYVTVANNIAVNSLFGVVEEGIVGTHNRYLNNLTVGNTDGNVSLKYGSAVGTIVADPQFVNASLNDFHLQSTSPAINRATATFAPAVDFDGIRRPQGSVPDIGAYERVVASMPSGWSFADIGAVGKAGSTSWSNGVWTVAGAGADIWGTVDAFRFVSRPMSGDGEIVARVTSQTNTYPWAKCGVMIRETLGANSRYAMCSLTPTNGTQFLRRLSPGGASSYAAGALVGAPYWLKLERVGTTFTAYQSANGTTWTRIGAATVPMGTDVFVGLAVSSHDVNAVSTAVFDSVLVTAGPVGSG